MFKLRAFQSVLFSACLLLQGLAVQAAPQTPSVPSIPPFSCYQMLPQPARAIVSPMYALQFMLETYAVDHQGAYPSSLRDLHQAAEKGDYSLTGVTRRAPDASGQATKGESILPELEQVRFLDPVTVTRYTGVGAPKDVQFPAKLVWEITAQSLQTRWIAPGDWRFPAQGAVLYMPIYPEQNGKEIRSYYILRLNQQGAYYTDKGGLYFLSNLDERETALEAHEADTLKMLQRQVQP